MARAVGTAAVRSVAITMLTQHMARLRATVPLTPFRRVVPRLTMLQTLLVLLQFTSGFLLGIGWRMVVKGLHDHRRLQDSLSKLKLRFCVWLPALRSKDLKVEAAVARAVRP